MKNYLQYFPCVLLIICFHLIAGAKTPGNNRADRACSLTVTTTVTHASAPQAHDGSVSTNVTNGTAPFTYQWYSGQTSSGLNNLGTGVYYVTVTDAASCTASAYGRVSAPGCQNMSVGITFSEAGGPNENIAFVSNETGTPPFTYVWSTGATTDSISHLADGLYCVTVTDSIGCSVTACAGNAAPTGIEQQIGFGEFKLYPNPANDVLTVEMMEHEAAFLTLASLEGRVLLTQQLHKGVNIIATQILPDGVYVYAISTNAKQKALHNKLLITH